MEILSNSNARISSLAAQHRRSYVGSRLSGAATCRRQSDACALLTEDQVSTAIEAKAEPGQHMVPSSTRQCIWSDDPSHDVTHRRVTLNIGTMQAFTMGRSAATKLKTEAVSGVGDDAYYILFGGDSPQLVVRKGDKVFDVRVLDGFQFKPLTDVKARELTLAKAAAAKL
jgi:hypothetical protein